VSLILGIETSCDETGVAIVADGRKVLSNEVASQIDIHRVFGGVVPEIASRQHTTIISQIAQKCIGDSGHTAEDITAIAATCGPGLLGSLWVGLNFAKALAYAWQKPFIPIHHIEGHLFSTMLTEPTPEFPFLALVVSGGHTQLINCPKPHHYSILGSTRDDAVGESFDKVARLLGLPYPGGPSIQDAAQDGNPKAYDFPRAMCKNDSLEFSYSGLKTAVLYALQKEEAPNIPDMAASFQAAAIDALLIKTKRAIKKTRAKRLVLAGGVAANKFLRERLTQELGIDVFLPAFEYCVDNGAMIAAAGHSRLEYGHIGDHSTTANPALKL
jgi:tRNA N6-adenosine threonylcarbamoyltransferase